MAKLKFDRGIGYTLAGRGSINVPNDEVWRVSITGGKVELAEGGEQIVDHQITLGGGTKIYNPDTSTSSYGNIAVVGIAFKVVN